MSAEDYDSILETLEILGDRELMRELADAEAESARSEVHSLDEVTEAMREAGRLPR